MDTNSKSRNPVFNGIIILPKHYFFINLIIKSKAHIILKTIFLC